MSSSAKRYHMRLYFYGNCQMTVLGQMLLEQHPEYMVTSCDISSLSPVVTAEEVERHLDNLRAADVVVSQPVSEYRGKVELSIQALRDTLPARVTLLTMPSIVFEGQHGAFTYAGGRLSGYHMPYHNSHTIEMALRGYDWNDICTLQNAAEFYTATFVRSGIDASLATLSYRETSQTTDIRVSPLLDEYCRSMVVMHTINHPSRIIMARVLDAISAALSIPGNAKEGGEDYMLSPRIPPLPAILYHLGIRDVTPTFFIHGRSWTRGQYLSESLAYYGRLLQSDLLKAFEAGQGAAFMAAFRRGHVVKVQAIENLLVGLPEEAMSALVTDGFKAILNRSPTAEDLAAHSNLIRKSGMRHWLTIITESVEFRRVLGRCQVDS